MMAILVGTHFLTYRTSSHLYVRTRLLEVSVFLLIQRDIFVVVLFLQYLQSGLIALHLKA